MLSIISIHHFEWPTQSGVCGRTAGNLAELHAGHRTPQKGFFLSRNHDPVTLNIPQTLWWAVLHGKYTVTPFHPSIYLVYDFCSLNNIHFILKWLNLDKIWISCIYWSMAQIPGLFLAQPSHTSRLHLHKNNLVIEGGATAQHFNVLSIF